MNKSTFVYVTYIKTTKEKLWEALTSPAFQSQYWYGCHFECTWAQGAEWKLYFDDGTIADTGVVSEIDKPNLLTLSWQNEFRPELKEEGYATCKITLEDVDSTVKMTVLHEMERPNSKLIGAVSQGWPAILSGLKSLLETGVKLPLEHM